jgi:hypothetical protein
MMTLLQGGAQGKTGHQTLVEARERLGKEAFIVYMQAIERNRIKIVDCATGMPAPRFRSVRNTAIKGTRP